MRNLYDEGTYTEAEVREKEPISNNGTKDASQHENEAPSRTLLIVWVAGAVLLGFFNWLNNSMKNERNFGRRAVRNYTEGLALFIVIMVLIITIVDHHDLPMRHLIFPLLTMIASVTFVGQYITRLLRYRVHMDDVNYVVPVANAVAWMISEEESCHPQQIGVNEHFRGWKRALLTIKEGAEEYLMGRQLEEYSRMWFLEQFNNHFSFKYKRKYMLRGFFIDMLRLPDTTFFWVLGVVGVIAGLAQLHALQIATFAWLFYSHISKMNTIHPEPRRYAVNDVRRLLLANVTDEETDKIRKIEVRGKYTSQEAMALVLTSNFLVHDFCIDIAMLQRILEVYGVDGQLDSMSQTYEIKNMYAHLASPLGKQTRQLVEHFSGCMGVCANAYICLMIRAHKVHSCPSCWEALLYEFRGLEKEEIQKAEKLAVPRLQEDVCVSLLKHGIRNIRKLMVTHIFQLWNNIKRECQGTNVDGSDSGNEGGVRETNLCQQPSDRRTEIVRNARAALAIEIAFPGRGNTSCKKPDDFFRAWIGQNMAEAESFSMREVECLIRLTLCLVQHVEVEL